MKTIIFNTDTGKIESHHPDGYKVNGKIQPLGEIEPNILHLEYVINPMPAYDMETHRIETSFEVIGDTYAQTWQVIELTPQELHLRNWDEPNYEIRILASKDLVFDDIGSKMFAWFNLNGLPIKDKDKDSCYLYCNKILEKHEPLITHLYNDITIEFKKPYLKNNNTGEIHRRSTKTMQCNAHLIVNKTYLTEYEMLEAMSKSADGCGHCFPEKNFI